MTDLTGLQAIDVAVGANVRRIRKSKGMSQTTLGQACGVTFQQVQKYERGSNRIAVATLIQIAMALQVAPVDLLPKVENLGPYAPEWFHTADRLTLELARLFGELQSPSVRSAILGLVRTLQDGAVTVD